MDTVQNEIKQMVNKLEKDYNIKIPLAIESGSRAWGFQSPDSDYDCRFIYVNPLEEYISVFPKRDVLEYMENDVFDINGWDITKVIKHIVKSNAVMHEWLMSDVIYKKNSSVWNELHSLAKQYFNPVSVIWHYLSMAKKHYETVVSNEQTRIKKYCYVLRPIACIKYISQYNDIPNMEYHKNLEMIDIDNIIKREIELLLEIKSQNDETHLIPKNNIIIKDCSEEIEWAEKYVSSLKYDKLHLQERANESLRRVIKMVW